MALTKVAVIYSISQNVRRRLITSDLDDSEIDAHKKDLLIGEGWLEIPLFIYNNFKVDPNDPASGAAALDNYITKTLGERKSDRCIVVDSTNKVVAVIRADPFIDRHPAGTLHPHETAMAGDNYTV